MTKNDLADVSNFYINQHMGAKKANSVNHCIRKIIVSRIREEVVVPCLILAKLHLTWCGAKY